MAQIGIQQAIDQGGLNLWHWAETVMQQIQSRMATQKVWPQGFPGPYAMYKHQNEQQKRRKKPGWVSTGNGYKSLYATVYNAAGGQTERIIFFFNQYLEFVDMGVGAGVKAGDVERSKKAKYNQLYAKWGIPKVLRDKGMVDTETSRRHRPILQMEIRHQLTRLNEIVQAYYGEFAEAQIIEYLQATDEEIAVEIAR